jgi:acyl transferase domain-containing protein
MFQSNFLAPSIEGQQEVMKECLLTIENSTLDYVECHATGTTIGDAIEIKALKSALQSSNIQSKPFLGSVKANVGHAFAASGMISLAKCLKILETHQIPPQINVNHEEFIGEIDEKLVNINTETINLHNTQPIRIMINNFGIGGTNACLIIEESKEPKKKSEILIEKQVEKYHLLMISAKSSNSCVQYCHKLADYLTSNPNTNLATLSNTLRNYRDQHEYRYASLVKDVNEAISSFQEVNEMQVKKANANREFAFYFCHQGLQYAQMLRLERQLCNEFNEAYNNFICNFDENQLLGESIFLLR